MKFGLLFAAVLVGTVAATAACTDGGPGPYTGNGNGGGGGNGGNGNGNGNGNGSGSDAGGGGVDASSSGGGDASAGGGDSGGGGGGFATAAWVGNWSCTSSGTLNGSMLPTSASTVVITEAAPNQLTVVSMSNGSGNQPCTLHATLTSDSAASFPMGQACTLTTPVPATLTLTANSTATLAMSKVSTVENIVVSNSPGFNGQTGTLTGTCAKM